MPPFYARPLDDQYVYLSLGPSATPNNPNRSAKPYKPEAFYLPFFGKLGKGVSCDLGCCKDKGVAEAHVFVCKRMPSRSTSTHCCTKALPDLRKFQIPALDVSSKSTEFKQQANPLMPKIAISQQDSVGALIIRTGFWSPLYSNYNKEPKIVLVSI